MHEGTRSWTRAANDLVAAPDAAAKQPESNLSEVAPLQRSRAARALALTRLRAVRVGAKMVIDAAIFASAAIVAYVARFEGMMPTDLAAQMAVVAPLVACVYVCAIWIGGAYSHSWRLFSLRDAVHLVVAGACATALAAFVAEMGTVTRVVGTVPNTVAVVAGLGGLMGVIGVRALVRIGSETTQERRLRQVAPVSRKRTLLVGAGRAGRLAATELQTRPDMGCEVVGFLDDDPARRGQKVAGVRVQGTTRDAKSVSERLAVDRIILTMPSASREAVAQAAEACTASGRPVEIIPGFYEVIGGRFHLTKSRPLRIEDLLRRQVVLYEPEKWVEVMRAFGGKRVMVTGAGGSIGSELCRQLVRVAPSRLILVENHENNLFEIDAEIRPLLGDSTVACLADVRDEHRMDQIMRESAPQVIFHAAAYKHVPLMQHHPADAVDNNVRGTKTMVDLAHRHEAEVFVMISTDKAVNPTNVMGASKRLAELVVQARAQDSKTRFSCVRFGNVLGSRGSVVHTFRRQIEAGGPVTVTHPDVERFFMTIPEAVQLIIQAGAHGRGGEIFVLDMGKPVRIVDLARQMLRLAGVDDEVRIAFTGLRPGEKMFEELLRPDEPVQESGLDRVFLARSRRIDPDLVTRAWSLVEQAAKRGQAQEIPALLAKVEAGLPVTTVAAPTRFSRSGPSDTVVEVPTRMPASGRRAQALS